MKHLLLFPLLGLMLILAACGNSGGSGYSNGGDSSDQAANEESNSDGQETSGTQTDKIGHLQVLNNDKVGKYLADGQGMTLYIFTKDEAGESYCKGGCLDKWPAFYAKNLKMPEGYDSSNFGTITRENGNKQTTYKGHPLYYYAPDKQQGDVKGQGVGNVWYIVNKQLKVLQGDGEDQDEGNYGSSY
ncbi:MAG TPA: hypothetical protein VFT51_14340 [Bacillales bacterium]|nr:hypothetical protein [Bacillales bacterium]